MSHRPPKSPVRILSGRRSRMLLEIQDIVSWWYSRGPGVNAPKLNIAYSKFALQQAYPPDLDALLRREMRERGWWEYEKFANEQEAARQKYNANQSRMAAEDKAQKAFEGERTANWNGPQSNQAPDAAEREGKGGQIWVNILAAALVLGILVKCTGIGGGGCGSRADEWHCE